MTFLVDGVNANSGPPVLPGVVTVVGTLIRIDGCINANGFSVPSLYTITVSTPALAPGNYVVEYWRASCDNNGQVVVAPALQTLLSFVVVPDVAAIPATTNLVLAFLAFVLAAIGYRVHVNSR